MENGVLDTVARINSKLAGENGGEAVLESLRQLQAVPMTFQVLEATKVGRAVNALRKNASSDLARELAAALFGRWKALAEEHFRRSRSQSPDSSKPTDVSEKKLAPAASPDTPMVADKSVRRPLPIKLKPTGAPSVSRACKRKAEVPTSSTDTTTVKKQSCTKQSNATAKTAPASSKPIGSNEGASLPGTANPKTPSVAKPAASLANKAKKLPDAAPPPKPGGSSGRKRKEAPAIIDEARLAMVKRRLQERYKEAADAKEKRRIQFISVPGQATRGPVVVRRREVVRCGAAIGSVKQAPVPSSSRMFRAS
ncbi:hypothetical protein EJB05_17498, partial [Eragrostis curvula]